MLQLLEDMAVEQNKKRSAFGKMIRLDLIKLLFTLIRCYEEWLYRDQYTLGQRSEWVMIVNCVQQYLLENIERKPDIALLSKAHHISSRHLNRLLKQDTGMTVMEMTQHLRINKAKLLLANTNDSIVEISRKVGYEDPSFFMKLFTRNLGSSPAQYRKKFR
ncbi:MAG TPA: AraC family transcriptional regulator [Bacilli bacterium]